MNGNDRARSRIAAGSMAMLVAGLAALGSVGILTTGTVAADGSDDLCPSPSASASSAPSVTATTEPTTTKPTPTTTTKPTATASTEPTGEPTPTPTAVAAEVASTADSACPRPPTPTPTPSDSPTPTPTPGPTPIPAECRPDQGGADNQPGGAAPPIGNGAPDAGLPATGDDKDHDIAPPPSPDIAWMATKAVADEIAERVGLEGDMTTVRYAGFAGLVLEPAAMRTWLYWKGSPPGDVAAFLDGLRGRHPTVSLAVRPARYSLLELHEARSRVTARIKDGRPYSVDAHTFIAPSEGTCLTVEVTLAAGDDPAPALARAKAELEAVAGVIVHVVLGERTRFTAGRWSDREKYWGGIRLANEHRAGGRRYETSCSSGLAVTKAGKDHLLTTAHCFVAAYGTEVRNGADYDGGRKIGDVDTNFVVRDRDVALITVPSSISRSYGGGINDPRNPPRTRDEDKETMVRLVAGETKPPYKVDGRVRGVPTGTICVSGATTGVHCELTVSDADVTFFADVPAHVKDVYDGLEIGPGFRLRDPLGGIVGGSGDSGGPAFYHKTGHDWIALGITSGGAEKADRCGEYPKAWDPDVNITVCYKRTTVIPFPALLKATGATLKPAD